MNLNHTYHKATLAQGLSSEELAFAEAAALAADTQDRILVNSILALRGSSEQIEGGRARLSELCQQTSLPNTSVATLLLTLEHIPGSWLKAAELRKFIFDCADHSWYGARVNSMRVLRRLAGGGDDRAVDLLKKSLDDAHECVRNTAEKSLRLATGHGDA